MIDQNKVFSFDIFDTTLTRCVAQPKHLFRIIQRILRDDGSYSDIPSGLRANFHVFRFIAELVARLSVYSRQKGEIRIEHIYQVLGKYCRLDDVQQKRLIALECAVEYDSIRPIAGTLLKIKELRAQYKRVVFISDMYLPLALIKQMLLKVGAYQEGDVIYLSSELGMTKFSGALFLHVLKIENCASPSELCHYGDDIHTDVKVPHQFGVSIYQRTPQQVNRILRFYSFKRFKRYLNILTNV